jgi:hypothetical protein
MAFSLRRTAAFCIGLGVAVLAAEIALRALGMFNPPNSPPIPRYPGFYRPDPEIGYTLWPSRRTTYRYPIGSSNEIVLVSNADGFRNARDFDSPDSRPRIWMLGDSMVLGDGVPAERRLTEVIEALEPGWRVDNLGMSGYSVDLMVRAYERLSARVEPDVVILGFYTDDFRRLHPFNAGQGYPFPKFALEDGRLVDVPFPVLPAWRRLRVVQAVEQSYWRLTRNQYELHAALLDRLQRGARDRGAVLAIVFLPGTGDTPEDAERRAWLRAWSQRAGVPFLDLTDAIHAAGPAAFIPNNAHWNELGHRLAGEAIRAFLRQTVLRN